MKKYMSMVGVAVLGVSGLSAQEVAPRETEATVMTANAEVGIRETGVKPEEPKARRCAVFVKNRTADKGFDRALEQMKSRLTAKVSGRGFEIVDFQDTVEMMKDLPPAVKTADGLDFIRKLLGVQREVNDMTGNKSQKNLGGQGTTANDELFAQVTKARLAQNMGADYLLFISFDNFTDDDVKDRNFGEARWQEKTYTLSASYVITDWEGYSLGGDVMDLTHTQRIGAGDRSTVSAVGGGLHLKAADKLAEEMIKNQRKWRESSLAKATVPVFFDVLAYDFDSLPLYLPAFDPDSKEPPSLKMQYPARLNATVEVDGFAVGTTDCEVQLLPGIHKVRFHRAGHDDIHMTINVREGLQVVPYMRMTEGEKKQIKQFRDELRAATREARITDAQVAQLKGRAQMLANSSIRVDAKNLPEAAIINSVVDMSPDDVNRAGRKSLTDKFKSIFSLGK